MAERVRFRRATGEAPGRGEWAPGPFPAVQPAWLGCPGCGRVTGISSHAIAADGAVSPSLVCPHDDCAFHAWGVLEGWVPSA